MRLDMQRDRKLAKRKGFALRTILAVLWFSLCIVAAYFFVDWLFETEQLTYRFFHARLFIPWEWDDWIIFAGVVFALVVVVNILILIGYALVSSTGRRRPGTPSLFSSDPDPDDQKYDYR